MLDAEAAQQRSGATPPVLIAGLALPIAGLLLLLASPSLDVVWEHHPSHFWLVLAAGGLNAALAYATATAAQRRGDARVYLVSLAFLAAAGFLGLHALATPGVLLDKANAGFAMATPVGLLVAAALAAASGGDLSGAAGRAVIGRAAVLRGALLTLLAVWAVLSLASIPPLDDPSAPERTSGPLVVLALAGVALYGVALARYFALYRRRAATMLLGMGVAFALLAEAMLAVAVARNWHATWWEWHLLMLAAFGLVAWSAHRQWHEERFGDLYVDHGSGTREISVLFADLAGFTSFSERHAPGEVTEMLNRYLEVAIPPIVLRHGGEIDRIVGDSVMATFNTRGERPDHARDAALAALAIQAAAAEISELHPSWPRFRVGVNTGEAAVGVVGVAGGRTHTAIGDTVNLASRIEGAAPVGGVALGPETVRRLPGARTEPLGPVELKGKSEAVQVEALLSLPS